MFINIEIQDEKQERLIRDSAKATCRSVAGFAKWALLKQAESVSGDKNNNVKR